MDLPVDSVNEQLAAAAFTGQSGNFDAVYATDKIIRYKRDRVRKRLLQFLKPGSLVLELNAGTGEDAVFLARQGHFVHATDISEGMQKKLVEKVSALDLQSSISAQRCSYSTLDLLVNKGPYDCIFSNFAGLNCTGDLRHVLAGFDNLLKPGGCVVLVVLPKFCLWESLLMLKGKFKTATRRFFSSHGAKAQIDGAPFTCWYYSPGQVSRWLGTGFELLHLEGLCTIVPPSYIENFAKKYPGAFAYLCKLEDRFSGRWPWKYIGDYYIISLQKK